MHLDNASSISDSTGDTLLALSDSPSTSYSTTQSSTKRWILPWELPALPKHVIEEIEQNSNGCISSRARRNIIQVLFNSLSAKTLYVMKFICLLGNLNLVSLEFIYE